MSSAHSLVLSARAHGLSALLLFVLAALTALHTGGSFAPSTSLTKRFVLQQQQQQQQQPSPPLPPQVDQQQVPPLAQQVAQKVLQAQQQQPERPPPTCAIFNGVPFHIDVAAGMAWAFQVGRGCCCRDFACGCIVNAMECNGMQWAIEWRRALAAAGGGALGCPAANCSAASCSAAGERRMPSARPWMTLPLPTSRHLWRNTPAKHLTPPSPPRSLRRRLAAKTDFYVHGATYGLEARRSGGERCHSARRRAQGGPAPARQRPRPASFRAPCWSTPTPRGCPPRCWRRPCRTPAVDARVGDSRRAGMGGEGPGRLGRRMRAHARSPADLCPPPHVRPPSRRRCAALCAAAVPGALWRCLRAVAGAGRATDMRRWRPDLSTVYPRLEVRPSPLRYAVPPLVHRPETSHARTDAPSTNQHRLVVQVQRATMRAA